MNTSAISALSLFLEAHNGNKSAVARELGVSRRSVNRWLNGVHPIPEGLYEAIGVKPVVVERILFANINFPHVPMPFMTPVVSYDRRTGRQFSVIQTPSNETILVNDVLIENMDMRLLDATSEEYRTYEAIKQTLPEGHLMAWTSHGLIIRELDEDTLMLLRAGRLDELVFEDVYFVILNTVDTNTVY